MESDPHECVSVLLQKLCLSSSWGKQDLCPQRQVELMAKKMAKDCCGARTGRRMYVGRSQGKISFQRLLRSCESVARQEAMKSEEEL